MSKHQNNCEFFAELCTLLESTGPACNLWTTECKTTLIHSLIKWHKKVLIRLMISGYGEKLYSIYNVFNSGH